MKILKTADYMGWRENIKGIVGFVPTMGALHEGHEQLLRVARKSNDLLVLSIYVNPTQFNDPKDFQKYPQTLERDLELAKKINVDVVLLPTYEELYKDGFKFKVIETDLSQKFCGASRPGHFEGVLTVVMKLLNIVKCQRAYFGEKDFQQLELIQSMVEAFFMNCNIIPVPTVRSEEGLALSSRNQLLTPLEQQQALLFPQILRSAKSDDEAISTLLEHKFKVDYVQTWNNRRLGAVFCGKVRLIDNIQLGDFL